MRAETTRRRLLQGAGALVLGAGVAGTPAASAAATGPFRIHMILWRGETKVEAGFRAYLADRGLAAEITVHDLDRDLSRLPGVLDAVRAAAPDLVYTWGTSIALGTSGKHGAADPATNITDLPVVSTMVTAPAAAGLVPESGVSGRNVTAVSHVPPLAAQLRAIRAYRPVTRLGVIYNPNEPNSVINVRGLREEAAKLGVALVEAPVPRAEDGTPRADALPDLIADLAAAEAEVLYIGPDSFVGANSEEITRRALDRGIPAFTGTELEVREAHAMFGLVSRYEAVGRLTGHQAERILVDGRDPGALPVETLDRFTYLIRLDVVRELGLYPPMDILRYAVVIE